MPRKQQPTSFSLEPIPISPSLESWYNSGGVSKLKSLVYDVDFRKGEALLKEQARPSRNLLRDADTNSISLAWYAGYCDAFRDLRKLCHIPKSMPTITTTEGWTHITE